MDIALDDRIELQHSETEAPALRQTILDQLLADVSASGSGRDRIARIAYVSAPSDIVRMQDVKSVYRAVFFSNAGIALRSKERRALFFVQRFVLRESIALLHHLVPDGGNGRKVFFSVLTYSHSAVSPWFSANYTARQTAVRCVVLSEQPFSARKYSTLDCSAVRGAVRKHRSGTKIQQHR